MFYEEATTIVAMNNAVIFGIIGIGVGLIGGYFLLSPQATEVSPMQDESHSTMETVSSAPHVAHTTLEIDAAKPIPRVALEALPDSKDGYNLHITATNFTFTPEKAGQSPIANEGHAHLFINGVKVARLYGPWFYVGSSLFRKGENTVEVTLNANDHSEWTLGEQHIAADILITK